MNEITQKVQKLLRKKHKILHFLKKLCKQKTNSATASRDKYQGRFTKREITPSVHIGKIAYILAHFFIAMALQIFAHRPLLFET